MIRNKAIWSLVFLAILTDASANPLIDARVYCKYGSAITQTGGLATIGDLPTGEYLVTASAQGYKSQSKLVYVTEGDPITVDFALESQSGITLSLTANPSRVRPDGISTSMITVYAADREGVPLSGKSVVVTTDFSTFQESGTNTVPGSTGDEGTLSATLGPSVVHGIATVTATCEGQTASIQVQFRTIIYVKTDGNDSNSGLSWDYAKATVQAGLNAASSGGEVWVKAGTYDENITLKAGVGLYGGFGATESYRELRNWRTNITTLDADHLGSVVTSPADAGNDTVIDGFKITNGSALHGGGVYCADSSPTIANNTIVSNDATGESSSGGGIYCLNSFARIIGNKIRSNTAGEGGGSAIYCGSNSNVSIINNVIDHNTISNGFYGAVCLDSSSGTIESNTVAENSGQGYAIDIVGSPSTSPPTIANNIVAFNPAGVCSSADTILKNNDVYYNPNASGENYCAGLAPDVSNISVPPLFVNQAGQDYHLSASSQCKNVGNNAYAQLDIPDMDGEYRIQDGTIDIGADEVIGCLWYTISLSAQPHSCAAGGLAVVTGTVVMPPSTGVNNWPVDVTLTDGVLVSLVNGVLDSLATGHVNTDQFGRFTAIVRRDDSGFVTLTAHTTVEDCPTVQVTRQLSVWFYPVIANPPDAWPMFMHDPQHTGASTQPDSATELLMLAWSAAVPTSTSDRFGSLGHPPSVREDDIFNHPYLDSSPVHAPGCPVIVGAWAGGEYADTTTKGYVVAFDPIQGTNSVTGDPVWRYPDTGYIGAITSTPCIADIAGQKRVYVGSMDGKVYCLNAQTGGFIWSFQTTSRGVENPRILASPVVYNGRVYVGNESARFYCLDAADGSVKWSYDFTADANWPDRTGTDSPAIGLVGGEPRVYVGCDNWHLYCLSTADNPGNRVIWDYNTGNGCIESSPTFYDNKIFFGTSSWSSYNLFALNTSGILAWPQPQHLPAEVRATCAAAVGALYVGIDTGTRFYKRDSATGYGISDFYGGNYFVSSAALCKAGLAYVGNDNGHFYALPTLTLASPVANYDTLGIVSSSPAVTYAAQVGARWVFITSRGNGGRLLAFRTQL